MVAGYSGLCSFVNSIFLAAVSQAVYMILENREGASAWSEVRTAVHTR